jgi:hypothetical protein
MLQIAVCAGRRALVVLPNDPDLVDILAKNGVDISVSEGEQQVPACPAHHGLQSISMRLWMSLSDGVIHTQMVVRDEHSPCLTCASCILQQGNYVALLGNLLFPLIAFAGLFFLFRGAGGQGGQASAHLSSSQLSGCFTFCSFIMHSLLFHRLPTYSAACWRVGGIQSDQSVCPFPVIMCDVLFKGQGGGMGGPFGGMGGPMEFGKNKSKFQETPETGISFDDVAVSAGLYTFLQHML